MASEGFAATSEGHKVKQKKKSCCSTSFWKWG